MSAFALFICPVTAECLFVRQDNGKWALPGGHREEGESPRATVGRECDEEIGYNPAHLDPVASLRVNRPWRRTPAAVFVYYRRPDLRLRNEITDARWCNLDDLPKGVARGLSRTARVALQAAKNHLRVGALV